MAAVIYEFPPKPGRVQLVEKLRQHFGYARVTDLDLPREWFPHDLDEDGCIWIKPRTLYVTGRSRAELVRGGVFAGGAASYSANEAVQLLVPNAEDRPCRVNPL
jgi:hypothetical protein